MITRLSILVVCITLLLRYSVQNYRHSQDAESGTKTVQHPLISPNSCFKNEPINSVLQVAMDIQQESCVLNRTHFKSLLAILAVWKALWS